MPAVRNVKYRKPRACSRHDLKQFADVMRGRGESALHVDLTRINIDSLAFLEDFDFITHLAIQGLTLRHGVYPVPNTVVDLCLLESDVKDYGEFGHMENIMVFDHRVGKAFSADGLAHLTNLKALQLLAVDKLSSIYSISELRHLEWFKIATCPDLTVFPDFSNLSRLRRVVLENLKGWNDLSVFAKAPALEDLIIMNSDLAPSDFEPLADSETPKRILPEIGTMISEEFAEVCRILKGKAVTSYYGGPFEFFTLEYGTPDQRFSIKLS